MVGARAFWDCTATCGKLCFATVGAGTASAGELGLVRVDAGAVGVGALCLGKAVVAATTAG